MASENTHDDDCCPNYIPMNSAKHEYKFCIAENKRLLEENARLKESAEWLKAETIKQVESAMPAIENYISQLEAEVERLNGLILRGASVPDAKPIEE